MKVSPNLFFCPVRFENIFSDVLLKICVGKILTDLRRPSSAAAPPGMILVMKMPGSSPMCGLSVPPAMLKPNPELPCGHEKQSVEL